MLKSVKKMKMSYIAPVGLMVKTDKCLENEIIQDAAPSKRQTENNLIGQPQILNEADSGRTVEYRQL